jgi:NitT/TauT family transport system substrate-binding protein
MKIILSFLMLMSASFAQTKVSFGTNWLAQAEHGGFYQAVADGTYAKHGLEVTIVEGGPQVNNRLLLTTGKLDFYLGGNLIQAFSALEQNVPTRVAAAIFQKDPQSIITHPHISTFEELGKLNLHISKIGMVTFYPFLKAKLALDDARVKPYTFNPAPFIADTNAAMQAYVTSEPFAIEKASGIRPRVFLLADYGFSSPSNLIETRVDMGRDVVEKFVKASVEGWVSYLYGDNAKGNALLKLKNPDMSDEKIVYAIAKMKEAGLVSREKIGVLDTKQISEFYEMLVKIGVMKAGLNPLNALYK